MFGLGPAPGTEPGDGEADHVKCFSAVGVSRAHSLIQGVSCTLGQRLRCVSKDVIEMLE